MNNFSIKEYLSKPLPALVLLDNEKSFLKWLIALVGFYLLPIMLADIYFADDWGRVMTGESWDGGGRWVQTAFFRFSVPVKLVDIAPLTLILTGVFLIASGFLIYKRLLVELPPLISAIICFIFFANPYYLENLSYRFDTMGMTLAILLNVIAFYLATNGNTSKNYILAGIFIMLSLCTYQTGFIIWL